ncbi:MAG: hypothetical protein R3174_01700 [Gammaproteobacteria bacterium]|nr:hypothetical protein [Gammaproteobacteria bacterium]
MNHHPVRRAFAACLLLTLVAPAAWAAQLERPLTGLTHQRLDGNRLIDGRGKLPSGAPVDIRLGRPVNWVVGVPIGATGSLWVAVLDDGSLHAVALREGKADRIPNFEPARLEGPPILMRLGRAVTVLAPSTHGSPLSHPVPIARQQRVAFVSENGLLSLATFIGSGRSGLNVRIPLDARIVADDRGRLLTLSDPTTRYAHGALGDTEEAASMTIVDAASKPRVERRIEFPESQVFEGLAPIWVDWNRDGKREIVATLSSDQAGAQIVLFSEDGQRIGESAPVGTGHRWRHAIAVAPFGPNGETELAEVVTPHLGRTVQFLNWRGERLEPAAKIQGFTSHVNGSRNLDLAAAGDFDGDGRVELLIPDGDLGALSGIRRTESGASVAWTVALPAPLSSNIGGIVLEGGQMVVAAGLADGTLRFWGAR